MVRLEGPCEIDKLEQAIQIVVRRHEALHVRFSEDGTYQEKSAPSPLIIPRTDLTKSSGEEADQALEAIFKRFNLTPFDLVNGPIIRMEIVKLTDEAHVLIVSCHHIVCDGWSWNVLLQEIGSVYGALCEGKIYRLGKTFQFSNYVMAELQRQTADAVQRSYDYWLQQFEQLPPLVELPTDHARPALKSYAGATVARHIRSQVYEAAKQAAVNQKVSLFAYLFSAFNLMLARLSGQDDVVVTVPAAGQLNAGQKTLVGYCVNLLPVRTKLDLDLPFADFVKDNRSTILDAYDHQESTYSGIVHRLNLPRDLSRLPLSEINFNMDRDDAGVEFGQLKVTVDQLSKEAVFSDIFFNLNEHKDGLKVDCDYNKTLFEESTIQRWIKTFEYVLAQVAANPSLTLADVSLVTPEQRSQILETWNETQVDYPRNATIHQLFTEQADETPDAPAILFENQEHSTQTITYSELNARANKLAHYLIKQGAGPDKLVGLCMERSIDMMVGLLGILKSGSGYVPMDPMFPQERLIQMVEDAAPIVVVTETSLSDIFAKATTTKLLIDEEWAAISQESSENPIVTVPSHSLAYVIYTSGSTGRPKGVQISHQAVVNFLGSMAKEPGLSAEDTILAVTTISFDIAVLELFLPLTVGAKVILANQEMSLDAAWLMDRLSQATVMQATPATWQMLLSAGWQGEKRLRILVGGEALSRELANQLLDQCAELWNMYGPTETTIWSSIEHVKKPSAEEGTLASQGAISIGRPIANTQFYILDEHQRPVSIGVVGNLYIGGDGLAIGYRNQPDLTAEKFIDNPFGTGRIYHTGDLARHRADGTVDFLGRSDFQVKIRGFRIELGEIESVLQQHDAIGEAVVTAWDDSSSTKYLVGYLTMREAEPSVTTLRDYLRERLPEYMIPANFVFMDRMPLTPNGKIDRKALPKPTSERPALDDSFMAAETPLEEQIVQIWRDVLEIDKIGIHDNFFDLGGHSLQATRILARLREVFDLGLNLRTFFTYPTVSGLASEIGEMLVADEDEDDMLAMILEVENMTDDKRKALLEE